MVFVLHTQWLEAQSAGCNIGDCYLVTATASKTSAVIRQCRPSGAGASIKILERLRRGRPITHRRRNVSATNC